MKKERGLPRHEAGQAVLIVLLGMAIALTGVLSILASSTTDIKISTNESQSLRAFSAAESGIEQSLISSSVSQGQVGSANYNATVNPLFEGQTIIYYPQSLVEGTSATLWFVEKDPKTGLLSCPGNTCYTGANSQFFDIYFGGVGNSPTPAIEATLFYESKAGDPTTIRITKVYCDPSSGRIAKDGLTSPIINCLNAGPYSLGSKSYAYEAQLDLTTLTGHAFPAPDVPQFLIVKMLYNSNMPEPIAFKTAGNLPTQGNTIDSTGTLSSAARKIEVVRDYNQVPPLFDAAIYSGGGLTQ